MGPGLGIASQSPDPDVRPDPTLDGAVEAREGVREGEGGRE